MRSVIFTTTLCLAALSVPAHALAQSCDIATAMASKRQAEYDRRMNGIDSRFQELANLNSLMTACLNNFPSMPTQWTTSSALTSAFQQVRRNVCEGLVDKAKKNYQQALNAAQNAGSSALGGQQVPSLPDIATQATSAQPTVPTQQITNTVSNTITDRLKRFFQ